MKDPYEWMERAYDDPDYDVENDEEAMQQTYTCDECGCTFTLEEAIYDFAVRIDGITYRGSGYCCDLCGNCAADKVESYPEL